MRGTILLILCTPALVLGHAFMKKPMTRNMIRDVGGCPHCGNSMGTSAVTARIGAAGIDFFPDTHNYDETVYAEDTHGLCGDPWQTRPVDGGMPAMTDQPMMEPTYYTEVYAQGDVIEIQVAVSTHHA